MMVYILLFLLTSVLCYHYYAIDRLERRNERLSDEVEQYAAALATATRLLRYFSSNSAPSSGEQEPRDICRSGDT